MIYLKIPTLTYNRELKGRETSLRVKRTAPNAMRDEAKEGFLQGIHLESSI